MKILVACEESGTVTKEFRLKGHEAYSCDLLPTCGEYPQYHIVGDVLAILDGDWDLIVAFPPCTHLAVSGAKHFAAKQKDGRQQQGIDFFMAFTKTSCPTAIENPIGIMSTVYRKPDQIVHPWMFGDEASKATCLWLKDLPCLVPTDVVNKGRFDIIGPRKKQMPSWYNLPPSPNRSKLRSKTFIGLAKAMAEQWG